MPLGAVALGTDLPCEAKRVLHARDMLTHGWSAGTHAYIHTHACTHAAVPWEVTHRERGSRAHCLHRYPQSAPRRTVLGLPTRAVCR